jgi:biopolymer transport protein TolR
MAGMLDHRRSATASGRFRRPPTRPISEINVTPFVDVMLVLLVIFMITAPLLATGVQVDLPKAEATALADPDDALAVAVDRRGRVFLQDQEVSIDALAPKLAAITKENKDVRIFVRGDASIDYGQVMAVLGALYRAGYRKVALMTEPVDGPPPRLRTTEAGALP